MPKNPRIGLAEAIEALRAELMDAVSRGEHQRMRFSLAPVELTVEAEVSKKADGRIGWSIVGAGGKFEKAHTQTVKVELTPLWEQDDGTLTSDFTVASEAGSGDTIASRP